LQAGVPGVVGGLWPVDDPTTALLMARFYHHHLKGDLNPASALALTQQWLRNLSLAEVLAQLEKIRKNLADQKDVRKFIVEDYGNKLRSRNQDKPFAHPYYWAAFTMNGI
jgi:CHAT domain-containing protein